MPWSQPFIIPALVLFIVAIPLVMGIIPRNRFYGMRSRKALTDDRIWYPVNRLGGLLVMLASMVYACVALLWPYSKTAADSSRIFLIHQLGFVLPLVVALVITGLYGRRL